MQLFFVFFSFLFLLFFSLYQPAMLAVCFVVILRLLPKAFDR